MSGYRMPPIDILAICASRRHLSAHTTQMRTVPAAAWLCWTGCRA